jgi:hypothetical protein
MFTIQAKPPPRYLGVVRLLEQFPGTSWSIPESVDAIRSSYVCSNNPNGYLVRESTGAAYPRSVHQCSKFLIFMRTESMATYAQTKRLEKVLHTVLGLRRTTAPTNGRSI